MLEWLQNQHNTQVRDTFELGKLYFKLDSYLHNFRGSVISHYFSIYTSCPIHYICRVRRTKGSQKHIKKTDLELGKPVGVSML